MIAHSAGARDSNKVAAAVAPACNSKKPLVARRGGDRQDKTSRALPPAQGHPVSSEPVDRLSRRLPRSRAGGGQVPGPRYRPGRPTAGDRSCPGPGRYPAGSTRSHAGRTGGPETGRTARRRGSGPGSLAGSDPLRASLFPHRVGRCWRPAEGSARRGAAAPAGPRALPVGQFLLLVENSRRWPRVFLG